MKLLDCILLILGIIFPLMALFGYIEWNKAIFISSLYYATVIAATISRRFSKKIISFIANYFFIIALLALIEESGFVYLDYSEYSSISYYLWIGAIGSFIAVVCRGKGYTITFGTSVYWIISFYYSIKEMKEIGSIDILDSFSNNYTYVGYMFASILEDPSTYESITSKNDWIAEVIFKFWWIFPIVMLFIIVRSLRINRNSVNASNSNRSYSSCSSKYISIRRISNQEAIDNMYWQLQRVDQLININQTSEAVVKLRIISEYFTKQIADHNGLSEKEMNQYSRVKYLHNYNYISNELYHVLTSIRKLGNKAAHDLVDDDRFNRNGLLKLRSQLWNHVQDWTDR